MVVRISSSVNGFVSPSGVPGMGWSRFRGDREDAFLLEEKGHLDALCHRLAHTDNAAATDAEAYLAGGADGFEFLLHRVCCAQGTEVGGGCLYVAVVVFRPAVVKRLQLLAAEEAHRGAALDVCSLLDLPDGVGHLYHILFGNLLAAGDKGEPPDSLPAVVGGIADAFFCRQEGIKRYIRIVMPGLGAPFTVFAAIPALRIDDGTGIELVSHKVAGDLAGSFIEGLLVGRGRQGICLFFIEQSA